MTVLRQSGWGITPTFIFTSCFLWWACCYLFKHTALW